MTKPWEETWRYNDLHPTDVFGEEGGDVLFEGTTHHYDSGEEKARARLAAAAPEMARLLLELEWAGQDTFFDDTTTGICPICLGDENPDRARPGVHTQRCALIAVLRKAGVLP